MGESVLQVTFDVTQRKQCGSGDLNTLSGPESITEKNQNTLLQGTLHGGADQGAPTS